MKFLITPRMAHRPVLIAAFVSLSLGAQPALAQPRQTDQGKTAEQGKEPDKPITQQEVGVKDVALTPLSDLNLKKGEIPQLLLDAQEQPYDLAGLARCPQIAAEIGELDAVLGEDIDVAQAKGQRISPGRAAQEALGSFIPFRGLIREVSGANSQQRKIQAAIYAGTARRAFLKGIGQQRGCRYPARSATAQIIAAAEAEATAAERIRNEPKRQNEAKRQNRARGLQTVSQPVVQKTR